VKAVPQPQLRARQNPPPLPAQSLAQIHFRGGEAEWLKLNSDLPRLIQCQTVEDLEQGFTQRLYRLMDFLFVLVHEQRDWRIIATYLHFCDENGQFLPERTVTQSGRIKRQGGGLWAGLRGGKGANKKEDTNLVGHFLTRESRRESADETIATYLGMTQEEKERELRRILISMDLILEVAEKNRCWRAAEAYLKMVDYDGSFLPMTSAARDRWEKTYARQVDKWEQLEKRRAEKAAKAAKAAKPDNSERTSQVSSEATQPEPVEVRRERAAQHPEPEAELPDNQRVIQPTEPSSDTPDGLIRLRVNVAPIDRIREAVQNPVHEAPVPSPSEAEIQALAAERARQAHQDKLNAAIPGRKFRGQKKRKPGAIHVHPVSTTFNAKGQAATKDTSRSEQPKVSTPPVVGLVNKYNSIKNIDCQQNKQKLEDKRCKDPP
jgi:hypothetical protein